MHGGIICENNSAQEVESLVMLVTNKLGNRVMHGKVHTFTLRICFRMVSWRFEVGNSQPLVDTVQRPP